MAKTRALALAASSSVSGSSSSGGSGSGSVSSGGGDDGASSPWGPCRPCPDGPDLYIGLTARRGAGRGYCDELPPPSPPEPAQTITCGSGAEAGADLPPGGAVGSAACASCSKEDASDQASASSTTWMEGAEGVDPEGCGAD